MQINPVNQTPDIVPVVEKVAPVPAVAKTERGSESSTSADQRSTAERLRALQIALAAENVTLKFHRDETTDQVVIEMVDNETGEPIRQMPSEVSLRLEAVFTKLVGHIVDETV
jgi:uncharacterized FlaG/YvyC family protein